MQDAQRARDLIARADALLLAADNMQNGPAGPPGSAEIYLNSYLQWRDDVERLLNRAEVNIGDITRLQSARHRSLVGGEVPARQLYREVMGEVAIASRVLENLKNALHPAIESAVSGRVASADLQFVGESGETYSYNPNDILGPPGAFGQVYRGISANRPVAVKRVVIRVAPTIRRAEDQALAEREVTICQALANTPSSHLVPLLDIARRDGELLLVMPIADRSLSDYISQTAPLDDDIVADIVRQMALGLQELASASVVHRDLKPGNILELDGRWCLADFGVSRIVSEATATLTWAGTGTVEYRAPEIWAGESARPSSDLYALGCVAFEMLTGSRAFPSGPDCADRHRTVMPRLPDSVRPDLKTLVLDLLAKSPSSRPPDARSVVEILSSRGQLSHAQVTLQGAQAKRTERLFGIAARDAQAVQHRLRQQAGVDAFVFLWKNFVGDVKRAVVQAESSDEAGEFLLRVGDAELRVTVVPAFEHAELLHIAVVSVAPDNSRDNPVAYLPGNLVCAWEDGSANWMLLRFSPEETSPLPGIGVDATQVVALWPTIRANPADSRLRSFSRASPAKLLDLLAETLKSDEQLQPDHQTG